MKRLFSIYLGIALLMLLLAGCGPSAEQVATMTASAWTPTPPPPTPTSTPTPVPFDVSVLVTDADGNPLEKALITIAELGADDAASQETDASGMAFWGGLPGKSLTLDVSVPGYFAAQSSETIQRGGNEVAVTLEREPNGFTVGEACLPDETLLYIDDFQDGKAEGWDAIEFGTAGWALQPGPDDPENMTVAAGPLTPNDGAFYAEEFPNNYVWRVKFMITGEGEAHYYINQAGEYDLEGQTVNNSQYRILLGTQPGGQGPRTGAMVRTQDPIVDMIIANRWEGATYIGIWHYLQISNYEGQVEVWLDGEQIMAYSDPKPLPPGRIGLGNGELEENALVFYDNMAVCQLNAPFTPMPKPTTGFDLTATVVDAEGVPLSSVNVGIVELGDMPGAQQTTDAEGEAAWTDLPGDSLTLVANAPGYYPLEITATLEKDTPNDVTLTAERDPFGMLPAQACAPGEKLLYVEDFQDGQAQGWPEIEFNAPGWGITADPNEPANQVASVQYVEGNQGLWSQLQGYSFENAVWRFSFMPSGRFSQQGGMSFNWLFAPEPFDLDGTEVFDSRYQLVVGSSDFSMRRLQQPVSNIGLAQTGRLPRAGEWHLIEIGTYQGATEVWMDGTRLMSYQDPNPLPPGTIGLEIWLPNENAPILYFDGISVCELSAPFVPMPAEE